MVKTTSIPTSYRLMVSSSIISKSVCLPLTGQNGVLAILALSDVSSLLPACSESLVVFQVFNSTVQPDTDLPIKAVMVSRLESNNTTLPTGDQYAMFSLAVCKYIPASKFTLRRKLECDWMLQVSAVWKVPSFPPLQSKRSTTCGMTSPCVA